MIRNPIFRPRKARWATTLLGGILLAQGAGKLLDPAGYVDALIPFDIIGQGLLWPAAISWMSIEVVSGVGLLIAGTAANPPLRLMRLAAGLAVGITLAYLFMTTQAYLRGLEIENCTCFGVYLTQRLSWFVLVQDLYMVAYAGWQRQRIRLW